MRSIGNIFQLSSGHSTIMMNFACLQIDLSHHPVRNVTECQKLMEQGWRNRAIGATLMNADSSRSHSIFTISVEMIPVSKSLMPRYTSIRRGKLNLVDLAGSERQAKTGYLRFLRVPA